MKKLILLFLFLTSMFSLSFAWCLTWNYKIIWPNYTKIDIENTYKINSFVGKVSWYIIKNNKPVVTYQWDKLSYIFQKPWKVVVKADFSLSWCNYSLNKPVFVYKKILLAIWNYKKIISALNLANENILFTGSTFDNIDENILKISDYVFIPQETVLLFLEKHKKDLNNKSIILLISSFKGFYSKLIIPYIKDLKNTKVYIYDQKDFLNIIYDIYQNKKLSDANLVSLKSNSKTYLPLSYFVNKLIQKWISIDLIWIVLVAVFWTILIAFFRQIIWFSVFGVYTPLIFSILIVIFGWKLTLSLFFLSILANIVTYFITRKIYVLYSSKISLNYIIYTILSIIFIGVLFSYDYIDFRGIWNWVVLLFIILPLLTKNLIKEDTKIFSKAFLIFVIEFIFITSILLFLFSINILKYILVAYPDLLWLCLLIVILIGRFTWLQLLEYIRFAPLIKKNLYEEE